MLNRELSIFLFPIIIWCFYQLNKQKFNFIAKLCFDTKIDKEKQLEKERQSYFQYVARVESINEIESGCTIRDDV